MTLTPKRRTATKKPTKKAVMKPYEPTPEERVVIKAMVTRMEEFPVAPRVKVTENEGVVQLSPDHPDPGVGNILLMEALGTVDLDFLDGLLKQLANAGSQGKSVDESGLNFLARGGQGRGAAGSGGSHARRANGRRSLGDDDLRPPPGAG